MKPIEAIEQLEADRAKQSDAQLLDELRALAPLPDEDAAAWERDETWARAYLLVAMSDLVAVRRLEDGIGLILDKMCLGDPGEMMRGLRHALCRATGRGWSRSASGELRRSEPEPATGRSTSSPCFAMPRRCPCLLDDPERDVAVAAMRAARTTIQQLPEMRMWFDSRTSRLVGDLRAR